MSSEVLNIDKDSYQPIRVAARVVHRSRTFVRNLIERGEVVAIVAGGTPEVPWLQVKPSDVEAAIRRLSTYVPKGIKRQQLRGAKRAADLSRIGTLHPAVQGMKRHGATHG